MSLMLYKSVYKVHKNSFEPSYFPNNLLYKYTENKIGKLERHKLKEKMKLDLSLPNANPKYLKVLKKAPTNQIMYSMPK